MRVLALCGSLRDQSLSLALLRAAAELAPAGVEFHIFQHIGELPLFNPNWDADPPASVRQLWDEVAVCDAVVIASPEYAHGITGTLKNALDWLVGHVPFVNMPVAVFNPAYESHHADDSLREVLRTMSAQLIPDACVRIPVIGSGIDPNGIGSNPEFSAIICAAVAAIAAHPAKLA